jgi:N-acetylglucosaminyldiphosphoundecaprenol N-acetyl-beta-D-mannosaminyltransferase
LRPRHDRLHIDTIETDDALTLRISGAATAQFSDMAIAHFRKAVAAKQSTIVLDVKEMQFLDARFLGILLMLRRELMERGAELRFAGVSASIRRLFRLHEGSFLLSDERGH